MPQSADHLGFIAHYDRTNYSAFISIVSKTGFKVVYYSPGYYSSTYAEFFLPLWLMSYVYDVARFGLGLKNLASYNLFLLQKPGAGNDEALKLYAWSE